ncbi:MAG: TRAP transporter small permease [Limnohabitans sp.]|nr:TRAP transporter small permease [Limnohabitans sp.]
MSASIDIYSGPKIISDDGQFHSTDEEVDLSGTPIEAWVALFFFWALGLTVFHQFFTRYVLNNSAAWTEEIARYLLIASVFTGAAIGVAKNNHIQVDFFYRHLPHVVCRALSVLTDLLRCAFLGTATFLTWQMMERLGSYKMTIVDLPMNIVYGICMFGFATMFLRSLWVAKVHWERGYSVLEKPATEMSDR